MAIEEGYFHIIYYCAGADKTEREKLSETKAQDYYYPNQAHVFELPDANSRYMYMCIELKRVFDTAYAPPQIFNVMKLMSGILLLGNIDFIDTGDNTNTNTNSNTNAESQQQFQQKEDKLDPPKCQVKDSNVLN